MNNIIQNNFVDPGSPVHNPPFKRPITFSANFRSATVSAEVGNKSLLAELIPKPLESFENMILVTAVKSKDVIETKGIPYLQCKEINQIEITAPVTYKGRYFIFMLEILTNYIGGLIPGRELFALPMVPAHVDISTKDNCWQAKGAYFNQDKDVCALTFKSIRRGKVTELGPTPKLIMLRNVVSVVKGEPRLSAKLVTPRTKLKVSDIMIGEGTLQFCEGAPSYLRDLEIGDVKKASNLIIEIQMDSLRIVHDYGTEAQEKGLREKLHGFFPGQG